MQGAKTYWLVLCCFWSGFYSFAQNSDTLKTSDYSLIVHTGAGLSYYSTHAGVPADVESKVRRLGMAYTIRMLWQPDHKVSVGIESGYAGFYSYTIDGSTEGKLSVSAIPLVVEFSMPVLKKMRVYGGAGSYIITTKLDYAGKVTSHTHSLGWLAAASYVQPLSKHISLSGEVKWLNATEQQLGTLTIQAILAWNFYQW
jgi:hypothetical protein